MQNNFKVKLNISYARTKFIKILSKYTLMFVSIMEGFMILIDHIGGIHDHGQKLKMNALNYKGTTKIYQANKM